MASPAYYKSAADDELAAAKNRSSWDEIGFRPRVLVDCSTADQSTSVLGHRVSTPVFIAPAALAKLAHPEGEKALCRAAGAAGAIYVVRPSLSPATQLRLTRFDDR